MPTANAPVSQDQIKRRLLTILAADVAGFSRLVAEDEEGTLRRLNTCLVDFAGRIAAHDGRLVKTAGDGLLASFESPVEAMRCAIATQRSMAERNRATPRAERLRFRVGLNLGDVVVQGGDLLGDGVNVAARLEAIADPGGVCLSASVFEHVVGKIDGALEDLGEQELRHIPRPVRAYRVAGLGEAEPPVDLVASAPVMAEEGERSGRRRFSILGLSLALAALVLAVAAYFVLTKTSPPRDPVPTQQTGSAPPPATPLPPPATAAAPPAATVAATAARRFAPDQVPFVSDAIRERLRADYAAAASPKALAISRTGGSAWYVQAQSSEDEASRRALETCLRNAPEPCDLYAVGDRLVWERSPPPMPAKPYAPPAAERVTSPFDPARVPLAGPGMQDRLRVEYAPAAAFKAVAIARTGTIGMATRRASEDEATRAALEFCGDAAGSACAIVAIDDSFATPFPTTTSVAGLFDPASLPLPPADRDRLIQAYGARGGWKAVAIGRNARFGLAVGRDSESQAVADALSECRVAGGQDCLVQAIGIFAVLGR